MADKTQFCGAKGGSLDVGASFQSDDTVLGSIALPHVRKMSR